MQIQMWLDDQRHQQQQRQRDRKREQRERMNSSGPGRSRPMVGNKKGGDEAVGSTPMSSEDVKEATAKLKGMLGIGISNGKAAENENQDDAGLDTLLFSSPPLEKSVSELISDDNDPKRDIDKEIGTSAKGSSSNGISAAVGANAATPKKRNKVKKKGQQSLSPTSANYQQQQYNSYNNGGKRSGKKKPSSNSYSSNNRDSTSSPYSGKQQRQSKYHSYQQQNKPKSNSESAESVINKNCNFAWSAFQSSPDPSSLPLPAFNNNSLTTRAIEKPQTNLDTLLISKLSPPLHRLTQSVEELEEKVISEAKAVAQAAEPTETKQISNSTTAASSLPPDQQPDESKTTPNIVDSQSAVSKDDSSNKDDNADSNLPSGLLFGSGGINLAALTLSDQTKDSNKPPEIIDVPQISNEDSIQVQEMDPIAVLLNAAKTSPQHQPQPHHQPQHQQQQIHLLQQQRQQIHQPPFLRQYPNQPPPLNSQPIHQQHQPFRQQLVTIQVQVPLALLPGRQMMVHTPAGYPIPVVVPENVQPGMVIPVTVPAAHPPSFHPQQHPPHPLMQQQQHPRPPPPMMSQYHFMNQQMAAAQQQQHRPMPPYHPMPQPTSNPLQSQQLPPPQPMERK